MKQWKAHNEKHIRQLVDSNGGGADFTAGKPTLQQGNPQISKQHPLYKQRLSHPDNKNENSFNYVWVPLKERTLSFEHPCL